MVYLFVAIFAAVVFMAARVLYLQPGAFRPDRFPKAAAALGALSPKLGAVHGLSQGVPVSVRVIDAAASESSRDQVTVRAPAPGSEVKMVLRSVPRELSPSATEAADFSQTFTAEGHSRDEVDALLPDDVRAALLSLASPDAAIDTPSTPSQQGYRDDGRTGGRPSTARAVTLTMRDGEVSLTFESRRVTDAQLVAAILAVTRAARRAMNRPFAPSSAFSTASLRAGFAAVLLGIWGLATVSGACFFGGVHGISDIHAMRQRKVIYRPTSILVRDPRSREVASLHVPDDETSRCVGVEVERQPLSLTVRCGDQTFTDAAPLVGIATTALAIALGVWALKRPRAATLAL
jgi:hypothetical protein